jgi:hypothetical protein
MPNEMKQKPVVDERNLPRKAPVNITLILIVGLRAFEAPQWSWGAIGVILAFLWFKYVRDIIMFKEKDVNIFLRNKN